MNVDVLTYPLSPEAMFFTLGLERILKGAAIMASDRDEVLRILKTFKREARELVTMEEPRRFLPAAPTLEEVAAAVLVPVNVDAWKHTDVVGLAEVVKRAVEYLIALCPPQMTEDIVPEEFWPSALDHGPLTRAFALLCRPWTAWDLVKCGALMPDEVACLQDVLPETLEALEASVTMAVIDARAAKKTWLPSTLVSTAVQALRIVELSQDQRIADMFGEAAAAQEQAQRPSPGKPQDATATPAQKREEQQGSSHA